MTKKIEDASIDRPVWIGFGIAFFVLVMVAGISIVNVAQSISSVELLDHTHQVMGQLDDLHIKASRAENRQWAYMLTKDRQALDERDNFIKQIRSSLPPLLELTKDNKAQQARLTQLQVALEERFVILIESQEKFDLEGFKSIQALFDAGQESSNLIRNIIIQAEQEEQGLLVVRKEREFARVKTLAIVTVLLLSFLLFLSAWIRNAIRKRLAVKQEWFDQQAPLLEKGALQDAIFNSANFSSIATDAKGVIQIFNVGAERMLGYTAAEVMNKITPADISDPQEVIARAEALSLELDTPITPGFEALVFKASRGIEDIYELTYIRKDGSRFPAVVSVTALRDVQNVIIGYLLIGTDNTARKQAEEALLRAGALQSAIFNSANFSSIATDAKGVIQIFNVGAERMLGYTAAEVMNKITPADISDPQEVIARAAALSVELDTPITPGFEALVFKASRGIEDIYELTYFRKDGSRFPAVVSVTALRDAYENIIGYLLIGTDNTARKQVEAERELIDQRLRDLQFYTRSLIESNIDAIMTTNTVGIISDVNHEMEALTGCSREELIGTPFKNYFTDPTRAEAGIKRVLREAKLTNYELTVKAKDGKETIVSYNATTFHDSCNNLMGVFASARDINHRKEFERLMEKNNVELIAATELADKANMAKSEFLSSMSHELRTPLNAVLGFAQLMASDVPPPTASQQMSIDQILQAGWYLLRLINEILDLAMIESGKVMLSQEPMSLAEVLQDCEAMIAPQAQKRGIRMTFPNFDTLFYVHADRTRVKQVMINLLSNAIKYNRDGGKVTVDCIQSGEHSVRVSVTDTGNGLAPKQLEQLFQPFNRLGQESSSKEGTGIGLVVTKQLIELMGGTIGVESRVGIGSIFWVELAASSVPVLKLESDRSGSCIILSNTDTESQVATNKRTILYVEDNPANLALVEQLIARRSDLVLLSAIDAHTGIQMARAYQPDVILMDINLPGISGFAALKMLRKDPLTTEIPVLALSANAMPRDIEKGLEAGFLRYLTKPINVLEFMAALDAALVFSEQMHAEP
jgi:PAS domain S-box-containing protein